VPDDRNVEQRMSQLDTGGTERGTERLEAFSDGVFAIAITLLILDIKVPHLQGSADLLVSLLHLWPSYFAYLLSFVIIGIYCSNHHYVFKLYQKTNHSLNLLNLLFLLFIAFLPFPTAVLGEYMLDEANQTTAVTFYASSLLLTAASWLLIWLYATWGHRLIDRHLDSGYLRRMTLQYVGTVALYSSAVLVSPFSSKWGLGICVGLTLLYLLPPKSPADLRPEHQ
jgi:uncharacterized membrane protein